MKKLLFLAALTLCAAPAYAAPDRFEQMDKDGNGQVDWEEFQAAVPGMKRPAFDTSEWDNFMKSHMGGQKGMPPAGMGMPAGMGGKAMPPAGAEKGGMPMIQPPVQQGEAPGIVPPKN